MFTCKYFVKYKRCFVDGIGGIKMDVKTVAGIVRFGRFSRPFVNYMMENLRMEKSKDDEEIINYFDVLKLKWDGKYLSALKEIDNSIKVVKRNGMYYLFLVEKLGILSELYKDGEVDKGKVKEVFNELREKFDEIPEYLRDLVVEKVRNIREMHFSDDDLKTIRVWSEKYERSPLNKGFILIGEGLKKRNEGKFEEAARMNIEVFKILKDVPHPSGMISALNNAAWWLRDVNKGAALKYTIPLGYYIGYYLNDDDRELFNTLSTCFQIQLQNNNPLAYETLSIFSNCLSKLDDDEQNVITGWLKFTSGSLNEYLFDLDNGYCENTPKLRQFIQDEIEKEGLSYDSLPISRREMKDILSGKREYIQEKSLREIIDAMKFEVNSNTPIQIIKELRKEDIDKKFKINFEKYKRMKKERQRAEFLISYLAHPYKEKVDILQIDEWIGNGKWEIAEGDYYTKELINRIFEDVMEMEVDESVIDERMDEARTCTNEEIEFPEHPYYMAKRDISKLFVRDVSRGDIEGFVRLYGEMGKRERKMVETFVVNYGRYVHFKKLPESATPRVLERLREIVEGRLKLKPRPAGIGYYALEDEERKAFGKVLLGL